MSVAPVDQAARLAGLTLQRDSGLASQLALGQVVQAKVLRPLQGGHYLVRILGHEHTVESANPLRSGETINGRVVGLDERIELERLGEDAGARADAQAGAQSGDEAWLALGGGRASEVIEELFRRYRGTLDADAAERLRRAAAGAARPDRMALAGLVLAKAGLPLDALLLQSLYAALDARAGALAPLPEGGAAPDWWTPAQRVLNAQGGGAVAHRLGMLPLQAGERLIEVDAALFEERREAAAAPQMKHRKLVLTLETEHLGRLELRAVMADSHVRVALATESSASTHALLRHGESLSRSLAEGGWQVDEISYETRARHDANGAIAAAAEHLITPGSVNRLL